jgi:dihydroorotate dehydrogenase (fumarate)
MLCSALLRHGPQYLAVVERELRECMEAHGLTSVEALKGALSQKNCANPTTYERAQYVRTIAVDRVIQPAA